MIKLIERCQIYVVANIAEMLPKFFKMQYKNLWFSKIKIWKSSIRVYRNICLFLFLQSIKMVCKSWYKYKSLVWISNFFQLKIELYCENSFCTYFDHVSEIEANKKWK